MAPQETETEPRKNISHEDKKASLKRCQETTRTPGEITKLQKAKSLEEIVHITVPSPLLFQSSSWELVVTPHLTVVPSSETHITAPSSSSSQTVTMNDLGMTQALFEEPDFK